MARRGKRKKNSVGTGAALGGVSLGIIIIGSIGAAVDYLKEHALGSALVAILFVVVVIGLLILRIKILKQRDNLYQEIIDELLKELELDSLDPYLKEYDDIISVKSRQALEKYDDIKYFKESECLDLAKERSDTRKRIYKCVDYFLKDNSYKERPQYKYVEKQLKELLNITDGYRVLVIYTTASGNAKAKKPLNITYAKIDDIIKHPEYLMTKAEYNKFLKQQSKEELDSKKKDYYDQVNEIIDFANDYKERLVVKAKEKKLDAFIQNLFDRTVNSIQKIKDIDSEEWGMLDKLISSISKEVHQLVEDDRKISDYYESEEFAKIKQTCDSITQSQKDFNEYIGEKAESISKLFGTRIVRNETQNEDTYNYIRAYKKSITPFSCEVSSTVFSSAENNPIAYIIKYFYPNKSQYKEQINRLKVLIEELQTLKEAKDIIENYKKDYDEYIQNVPRYVLENDEAGFYSRLGLTIIDEAVLNVEYKFTYTSDGGMAQRSFTVPMNEENITELIIELENKLSTKAIMQEQRALMTSKLRTQIKERDGYACCQCGNSTSVEPNLLLEIDHIIPVSKGGLTREDNLQTLCWKCNRSKGAKLIS